MEWISIEDRLPEESYDCFVIYPNGYGYGQYNTGWDFENKRPNNIYKWYLDFDASGHEDEITHWMKIVYPDEE